MRLPSSRRARVLAASALMLFVACQNRPFVRVRVDGTPGAPGIAQLHAVVTLGANQMDAIDVPRVPSGLLALPKTFGLELPAGARGTLSVTISGRDPNGKNVQSGQVGVLIDGDRLVDLEVALDSPCLDGALDGDETGVDCGGSCAPCAVGSVCVVPGDCATNFCFNLRCDLASGPPYWLPAPSLSMPRFALAAATGADGTLYALAGTTPASDAAFVEQLAPGAAAWTMAPALPSASEAPGAARGADSRIYAIGGFSTDSRLVGFAPGAPSWVTLADMPTPRGALAAAATADGSLYALGGGIGSSYYSTVERYSIASNTWSSAPSMMSARYAFGAAVSPDGRIFALGGFAAPQRLATVEALRPGDTSWTAMPSLSTPRSSFGAALGGDGRIYAVGGNDGGDLASVEALASDGNQWVPVAALSAPRTMLAVALGPDGRLYAIGGAHNATVAMVEAYGPVLQLNPAMATAAASVEVAGNNFAAHAMVSVFFDGRRVATGSTDAGGSLAPSVGLTIPADATSGAHVIAAYDDRSRYSVVARLIVP